MSPHEIVKHEDGTVEEYTSTGYAAVRYGAKALIASSMILMASNAFTGAIDILTGGGGRGPTTTPDSVTLVYSAPQQPTIGLLAPIDTSTAQVGVSSFVGDQDDVQDSLQIQLFSDTLGSAFADSVAIGAGISSDTLANADSLSADSTYWARARYFGQKSLLWSDWSPYVSYLNTAGIPQITDLTVTSVTDSSATLQWTEVHNGAGGVAHSWIRWDTVPPIIYWEQQNPGDYGITWDTIVGTSVGFTASYTIQGLNANTYFESQISAYSATDDGPISPVASGTTSGPPVGSNPPATPTITLVATSDTSQIQMNGSGFNGDGSHDSTQWRLDNNSDVSSPFFEEVTGTALTSRLVTDNANLTAGQTYYGQVRYKNAFGWSGFSTVQSVVNTAPPSGGAHPNEPPGFTAIAETDFCLPNGSAGDGYNGPGDFERGGFGMGIRTQQSVNNNHPNGWKLTLQSEANTLGETPPPGPVSPGCIAAQNYSGGDLWQQGGGRPAPGVWSAVQDGTPNTFPVAGYRKVYSHYWMYMSSDFTHTTSCKGKIGYWRNGDGVEVGAYMIHNTEGACGQQPGNSRLIAGLQADFAIKDAANGGPAPYPCVTNNWSRNYLWNSPDNEITPESSGFYDAGVWNEFELLMVVNNNDACDGEFHAWVNGQKVWEFTDETFRINSENMINAFDFESIWGGSSSIPPFDDMELYFDHAYVSVSN